MTSEGSKLLPSKSGNEFGFSDADEDQNVGNGVAQSPMAYIKDLFHITDDGRTSMLLTCLNFMNGVLGAGILGLPYAFLQAGFLPGIIMSMFIAYMSAYTIQSIGLVGSAYGISSYPELAERAFGASGFWVSSIMTTLFAFGAKCGYLIIFADTIPGVFANLLNIQADRETILILTATSFLFPLCFLRQYAMLSRLSIIKACAMLFLAMVIIYYRFNLPDRQPSEHSGTWQYLSVHSSVLSSIGTMSFAFVCHHQTFLVIRSLRRPTKKRFVRTVGSAIAGSFTLSVIVAMAGYTTFFEHTEGDIIVNLDLIEHVHKSKLFNLLRLALSMNLLITYPSDMIVIREIAYEMYNRWKGIQRGSQLLHEQGDGSAETVVEYGSIEGAATHSMTPAGSLGKSQEAKMDSLKVFRNRPSLFSKKKGKDSKAKGEYKEVSKLLSTDADTFHLEIEEDEVDSELPNAIAGIESSQGRSIPDMMAIDLSDAGNVLSKGSGLGTAARSDKLVDEEGPLVVGSSNDSFYNESDSAQAKPEAALDGTDTPTNPKSATSPPKSRGSSSPNSLPKATLGMISDDAVNVDLVSPIWEARASANASAAESNKDSTGEEPRRFARRLLLGFPSLASLLAHISLTTLVFGGSLLVASLVTDLGPVQSITGSFCAVFLSFVYPASIQLKLGFVPGERVSFFSKAHFPMLIVLVFGVLAFVTSTGFSVIALFV